MILNIEGDVTSIEEISLTEFNVAQINSIEYKYPDLRQSSKAPTFALQYAGTAATLVNNSGFSWEEANSIYSRYHAKYEVSDIWVNGHIQEASKTGYVTLAFGLRLRTHLISQTVIDTSKTPKEAAAEVRTVTNALGQSWGMLNTRACTEFMNQVRSTSMRMHIKPCMQIHDASYYLITDDVDVLHFLNKYLVQCVNWNNDPLIYHPTIPLGGKTSILYPSWANEISIPNHATKEEIQELVANHIKGV